jgi:phosphoribosylformylglycinamidine cyclo-ligase
VKDNLPDPDPIFHLIQKEAKVEWREMYQDFNMGVGFEFVVAPDCVEKARSAAEKFGLGVHVIGRCEKSHGVNALEIRSRFGDFSYD